MRLERAFPADVPLLLGLLTLGGFSLVLLYSASNQDLGLLYRQIARFLVALVVMVLVARISPDRLTRWTPFIYAFGLACLVLVLAVGIVGKGAQRWLDLGLVQFQPAEVMKLGVPLMVAWWLTRNTLPPGWYELGVVVVMVGVPSGLVIVQPDLGTALLIAASGVVVIFLAGLTWRWIVALGLCLAVSAPLLWTQLHEYQQRRIFTLFDPWSDPMGAGYHTIQSVIAVGSGGLAGKGWLNGSQSHLDFIPERGTDFIFAVFAEEFGFYGGIFIMALYVFLVGRGLYISFYAQDTFSRLVAGSLSLTFFLYVFVNIGMVSGVLPVVGVPLPLVSYGGTSMVTLMAGFGILMSIHSHKKLMPR
ncbi:MAG: Peptidoglycan glycosyltransferase MrdB [Gammaproteobacteria bacterium]|nr:Peptidoglycan glycosyltransferase MrdB [Gammaproteobacteria bacterium]